MDSAYHHILEPLSVGPLELANRVIMVPMDTGMSQGAQPYSDREIAYFTERAAGGTALVITGATYVTDEFEKPGSTFSAIGTDDVLPVLSRFADSIHSVGGKLGFQLTAGLGRNANPAELDKTPVSASAVPSFYDPSLICRALETDEVKLLVRRMAEAAARVEKAGGDAVDIHGHTGYLIDQFLSSQWNHRTDEYGGSLENRCRFAVEIIRAIKEAAPGLAVSFRLSVDQRFPGGRTTEESVEIAKILADAGLDMMFVDDGSYEAMDYVFPPYYLGDGCMAPSARAVKEVVSIPVLACGNLDPDTAESVLASGGADLVGVGRGLIADPQWVAKLAQGKREDIRPCIRCNAMCIGAILTGGHVTCAVNPEAGFELERHITPAAEPRKVVIVGGGPAGLEAARVAALEGHAADLYERAERVGGVLLPAATPDFKRELHRMIDWWEGQLDGLPVTIHLNHPVTADDPALADADKVIIATGSTPLVPGSIPGIDGPNVVGVIEAHQGADLGKRVVVAGGGLSGADLALELAQAGHEVSIVEMANDIARDMLPINRLTLLRELDKAGIAIYTGYFVTAISPEGVTTSHQGGEQILPADSVVAAFGVRPDKSLAEELTRRDIAFEEVGDCVRPAKVGEAINGGYLAAMAL